jgi:hypothetical protein
MNSHNTNSPKFDPYKVLELSETATTVDVKSAYRRLAMKWHPDKNENSKYAEEKFKEISKAYEFLTNPPSVNTKAQESEDLFQAALEYINAWPEEEKTIPRCFLMKNPVVPKSIRKYLSEGYITPEEFEQPVPLEYWYLFENDDPLIFRIHLRSKKTISNFVDEYYKCATESPWMENKFHEQTKMRAQYYFWLYMVYFKIIFNEDYCSDLEALKWFLAARILKCSERFNTLWNYNSEISSINGTFNGPNCPLRVVYKKVITPIKDEIAKFNEKADAASLAKAKQLESIVFQIESNLFKEIPDIVRNRKYETDVYGAVIDVLTPYANYEKAEQHKLDVAHFIRAVLGVFITTITLGTALLSNDFRHRFFHRDTVNPFFTNAATTLKEEQQWYIDRDEAWNNPRKVYSSQTVYFA